MSKRTILIYGLHPIQQLALVSSAEKEGISCRIVADTETAYTVDQLLSGKQLPPRPALPVAGRYALLDGFDGDEDVALNLINAAAPGVIKAVHTKHNGSWHFFKLCSAIQEENDYIRKK